MCSKTSTLEVEQLNRNYDQDLKKYFCNIRTWKILLDESFEEYYGNFIDENWLFKHESFDNTIKYINTLLEQNALNIRFSNLWKYIETYSNAVKEILSDDFSEISSLLKLKDDLDNFASRIFKKSIKAKRPEFVRFQIKKFIEGENKKIREIENDYVNKKIDLTINTFTKKFFELI